MDPIVEAALIAAAPPTLMAGLAWLTSLRNHKSIGSKNGTGTVQEGLHTLVTWSADHTALDETRHVDIVKRLDALEASGTNEPPNEGDS